MGKLGDMLILCTKNHSFNHIIDDDELCKMYWEKWNSEHEQKCVNLSAFFCLFGFFYSEVRKRSDNQDDTSSVTSLAGTSVKKSALTKNCCKV